MNALEKSYLKRTQGEPLIPLQQIDPLYAPNEMTRLDQCMQQYMGKEYLHQGKRYATELLSVSLETLYQNPAENWWTKTPVCLSWPTTSSAASHETKTPQIGYNVIRG